MLEKPEISHVENSLLTLHRRRMDALTSPAFKGPRFNEAKQLVVDLLEGRKTDITASVDPIEFTAVNTDSQQLYIKKESRVSS